MPPTRKQLIPPTVVQLELTVEVWDHLNFGAWTRAVLPDVDRADASIPDLVLEGIMRQLRQWPVVGVRVTAGEAHL